MPKRKSSTPVTPEIMELREAVIEAARLGLRGKVRRPKNRNPLYRPPTKAGAAWNHLCGTCRALAEWGEVENLPLALRGVAEADYDQAANIAAVRKCVATLNRFLESLDAGL